MSGENPAIVSFPISFSEEVLLCLAADDGYGAFAWGAHANSLNSFKLWGREPTQGNYSSGSCCLISLGR